MWIFWQKVLSKVDRNRVSNLQNLDSDILKCFSFLPLKFAFILRSKLDIIFLRKLCCSFLYYLPFESLQNRKLRVFTFKFPLFKKLLTKQNLFRQIRLWQWTCRTLWHFSTNNLACCVYTYCHISFWDFP